jgi:hypothetical protein
MYYVRFLVFTRRLALRSRCTLFSPRTALTHAFQRQTCNSMHKLCIIWVNNQSYHIHPQVRQYVYSVYCEGSHKQLVVGSGVMSLEFVRRARPWRTHHAFDVAETKGAEKVGMTLSIPRARESVSENIKLDNTNKAKNRNAGHCRMTR